MPKSTHTVEQSLEAQIASCAAVGSQLYAELVTGLLADHRAGGVTAELLDGITDTPVHDALPLRYLATAHLLALTGRASELAAHYPSCGGSWAPGDDIAPVFLRTVRDHRDEFRAGLRRNVQTNEVGRAAVLASGFAHIGQRWGLPIDQLEIGGSAGLLSNWERYGYDTGGSRGGHMSSPLQFGPQWWASGAPDLGALTPVVRRRASDIAPIDVAADRGRATMMSFVWPDQPVRFQRLQAAIDVAVAHPVPLERADAGEWLARELATELRPGAATVVFHSIVWQYLPQATRDGVRAALAQAGSRASNDHPVCWLRMEPASVARAELRLTSWPGGDEQVLAEVGYHGADISWLARSSR